MNTDRLRHDLAELAEEALPVDLRDRALRTSRRLGIQRAVATSAAALVLLGAATGTAFALMPRDSADPAPADSPPATAVPSPTRTPDSTPPAPGPAVTKPGRLPSTGITGTMYYLVDRNGSLNVYSLRNGELARHLAIPVNVCASNSVSVSPDGRRVAWVAGSDSDGGTLTVADLDGTRRRTFPQKVYCLGNLPAWTADSAHLKVSIAGSGALQLLDPTTGRLTPQSPDEFERDLVQSPNGAYWAQRDGDQIVVRRSDGTVVRKTRHADESPTGGFTVTAVSDDGRYVTVGPQPSDPSRIRFGWVLVDMVTGQNAPLAVPATKGHAEILLLPGGAMIIRVFENGAPVELHQVSVSGTVVTQREPAQLGQDATLLGYRP